MVNYLSDHPEIQKQNIAKGLIRRSELLTDEEFDHESLLQNIDVWPIYI